MRRRCFTACIWPLPIAIYVEVLDRPDNAHHPSMVQKAGRMLPSDSIAFFTITFRLAGFDNCYLPWLGGL